MKPLTTSPDVHEAAASYTINKKEGQATVKFEITELIDKNGNSVVSSAGWTEIGLAIRKENDAWLKAEIN